MGTRKYSVNDQFFDVMGHNQYWLVGLLASDGSVRGNQIKLTQSGEVGYKVVSYVKDLLQAQNPIRSDKTIGKDSFELIVTSKSLVNKLQRYNVVRNKTLTYKLPDIPQEFICDFLAGYVEGDGCITISKNSENCFYLNASFVGTKDFVLAAQDHIPIKGHIRQHSNSSVYEIRWYGKIALKFCDWLYQHDCLYHGYKYENYLIAKEKIKKSRSVIYESIKQQVLKDLQSGTNNIMQYAKQIGIPFQTIYKWRKEWLLTGELCLQQ